MKNFFKVLSFWVLSMAAGGEEELSVGCCVQQCKDKELLTILGTQGCGSLSTVCCGAAMGGLCVKEGLVTSATIIDLGLSGACIGVSGAVACAMCGSQYTQKYNEKIVKQPEPLSMVYDAKNGDSK